MKPIRLMFAVLAWLGAVGCFSENPGPTYGQGGEGPTTGSGKQTTGGGGGGAGGEGEGGEAGGMGGQVGGMNTCPDGSTSVGSCSTSDRCNEYYPPTTLEEAELDCGNTVGIFSEGPCDRTGDFLGCCDLPAPSPDDPCYYGPSADAGSFQALCTPVEGAQWCPAK